MTIDIGVLWLANWRVAALVLVTVSEAAVVELRTECVMVDQSLFGLDWSVDFPFDVTRVSIVLSRRW